MPVILVALALALNPSAILPSVIIVLSLVTVQIWMWANIQ